MIRRCQMTALLVDARQGASVFQSWLLPLSHSTSIYSPPGDVFHGFIHINMSGPPPNPPAKEHRVNDRKNRGERPSTKGTTKRSISKGPVERATHILRSQAHTAALGRRRQARRDGKCAAPVVLTVTSCAQSAPFLT